MPTLNLILERRLAIRRDESQSRLLLILSGAAAGAGILGFLAIGFATIHDKAKIAQLREMEQREAPMLHNIDSDTKMSQALLPKIQILEQAQQTCNRWGRVMNFISHQTPPEVWLSSIRASGVDPSKPITATIMGTATAQDPVSEYVLRLQNSPDLENVTLKFTQAKQQLTVSETEFEIDADIKGTAQAKPKAPGGAS